MQMAGERRRKLRYVFLQQIDKRETFYPKDVDLTPSEYEEFVEELKTDGYLIDELSRVKGLDMNYIRLSEKGEKFLQENSSWAKAYRTLKEARSWLP